MRGRSELFVAVWVDYEKQIADLLPLDDHRLPMEEEVPFEVIEPFLDDSHRGGSGVARA
jgi:hypothetical protein